MHIWTIRQCWLVKSGTVGQFWGQLFEVYSATAVKGRCDECASRLCTRGQCFAYLDLDLDKWSIQKPVA